MKLASLPKNSSVFIDANIFLFAILAHPRFKDSCEKFLTSVEKKEYSAFTSTLVLNEVIHKLMLTEAVKKYSLRTEYDAYLLLKQKPEVIKGLTVTWEDLAHLKSYPITILSTGNYFPDSAVEIARVNGLLISDAV
ncbi:MAG: type II toxin-antitoxin system VapC family toxin, partial [Methanobacteriota archaeon]